MKMLKFSLSTNHGGQHMIRKYLQADVEFLILTMLH